MDLLNKDQLYDVLKNPTRENFRFLLQNHLGEEDYLDFKKEWPEKEKIVKHILAIANSGGGCIVLGLEQKDDGTFETTGLDILKDTSNLKNETEAYLPKSLKYHLKDFIYENSEYEAMIGKKFQILIIEDRPIELPFICCKDGAKVKNGDIFIRRGTESEKANEYEVTNMIQRKISVLKVPRKNEMDLPEHLKQLKVLYNELTYSTSSSILTGFTSALKGLLGKTEIHKKDCYPKEDYDDFIVRVLNKKKKRIEEELDV